MEDFAVPAEAALLAGEELCLLFQQSSAVLVRIPFDLDDIHALVIGAHRHDVNLALPVVSLRVCVPLWVPLAAYRPVLQRLGKLCAEIPLKCVSGIGRVVIGHRLREQRILADLYHRLILLDVTEPEEQEDVADFITDGLSILPGQDRAFLGYEVIGLLQFRQLSPLCSSRQDTQICRSECYALCHGFKYREIQVRLPFMALSIRVVLPIRLRPVTTVIIEWLSSDIFFISRRSESCCVLSKNPIPREFYSGKFYRRCKVRKENDSIKTIPDRTK